MSARRFDRRVPWLGLAWVFACGALGAGGAHDLVVLAHWVLR